MTYSNRERDNIRPKEQGTSNGNQSNGQTRQGSAQSSKSRFKGRSSSRHKSASSSNSAPKKSVKFADLTEQEMAQLRAEGKCFLCKEPGHMSRNCPRRNTVKGNGNNKPPGVPSFSMIMDLLEEDLEIEKNKVLESMPVGVVDVDSADVPSEDDDWRKWYPTWMSPMAGPNEEIGNCYEMTAEYLLTKFQPYPGDELVLNISKRDPVDRFGVSHSIENPEELAIYDRFNKLGFALSKSSLADPKFNPAHWYATKCAKAFNMKRPTQKEYPQQLINPVVTVASCLLRSGVQCHFPNVQPGSWTDDRFFVYLKDYGSTTYVIVDDDLELKLEIELEVLETPKFNLIEWYLGHAVTKGAFHNKYIKEHVQTYRHDASIATEDSETNHATPKTVWECVSALRKVQRTLERCAPYPGDELPQYPIDPTYQLDQPRFEVDLIDVAEPPIVYVFDRVQGYETYLSWELANWNQFSVGKWFAERCAVNREDALPWNTTHNWLVTHEWVKTTIAGDDEYLTSPSGDEDNFDDDMSNEGRGGYAGNDSLDEYLAGFDEEIDDNSLDGSSSGFVKLLGNDSLDEYLAGFDEEIDDDSLDGSSSSFIKLLGNDSLDGRSDEFEFDREDFECLTNLNGIQVDKNKYVSVQRNATRTKGPDERLLPKPVVIKISINDKPMRALIDSGSLGDFISSTAVDQLKLK